MIIKFNVSNDTMLVVERDSTIARKWIVSTETPATKSYLGEFEAKDPIAAIAASQKMYYFHTKGLITREANEALIDWLQSICTSELLLERLQMVKAITGKVDPRDVYGALQSIREDMLK